ncbi:hypothetical protein AVEN_74024-1 [Araneus ventricosus]|uniref:Uncharacterized protein n=1 Tax=Araneus ventricosus TaxID=182803 RepID=A0A4Y2IJG6_ARAVE|nr:hypothetical protein AVEN_74024-1 [Araneus ventricosus]
MKRSPPLNRRPRWPSEQYLVVLEEFVKNKPGEEESDALNLDGEVIENSDRGIDSETDVETIQFTKNIPTRTTTHKVYISHPLNL